MKLEDCQQDVKDLVLLIKILFTSRKQVILSLFTSPGVKAWEKTLWEPAQCGELCTLQFHSFIHSKEK